MATERMVPLDEETVALIDEITALLGWLACRTPATGGPRSSCSPRTAGA
jgi:hypothetical protein